MIQSSNDKQAKSEAISSSYTQHWHNLRFYHSENQIRYIKDCGILVDTLSLYPPYKYIYNIMLTTTDFHIMSNKASEFKNDFAVLHNYPINDDHFLILNLVLLCS
jgi:hypothetical protein